MSQEDVLKREESRRELDSLFFQIKQQHDALDSLYSKLAMRAHLQMYIEYRDEQLKEMVRAFFQLCSDMPTKLDDENRIQLNGDVWDWLSKRDQLLERVQKFYEEHGGEL